MHHIVEPPNPNPTTTAPISRRTLLESSAGAGLVAAAAGWGSAPLGPRDAHAANPAQGV
jgi:hypothetical protein